MVGGLLGTSLHATNSVEVVRGCGTASAPSPPMQRCRFQPRLLVVSGVLHAVGGDMEQAQRATSSTIERFDCAAQRWVHVTDIPLGRIKCASCCFQSKIFVFGGGSADSFCSRSWDSYDVQSDSWLSSTSLDKDRMMSSRKTAVRSSVAVLYSL